MNKRVTIKDLAALLSLAPSTVSRALRDHPNINPDTKARVAKLAKELNYKPNEIALSLRNQRTKTIGVIVPEIVHFFFSTIIAGIEAVAYERGYTVMICQSNESFEKEVIDATALMAHRVDGLLVSHSRQTKSFKHFLDIMQDDVPVVFFDRSPSGVKAPSVVIDDEKAAYEATAHLIQQGCRQVIHLAGPQNLRISRHRTSGYKRALHEAGIEIKPEWLIECFEGRRAVGYEKINQLLEQGEKFDGIFASNDLIAFGAMTAVQKAGMKVPNDVAVIGFSDWEFSSLVEPALSSVSQPGKEMGEKAVKLLIDMIEKKTVERSLQIVLETGLLQRASSLRH